MAAIKEPDRISLWISHRNGAEGPMESARLSAMHSRHAGMPVAVETL
jgi:hypothetical protein